MSACRRSMSSTGKMRLVQASSLLPGAADTGAAAVAVQPAAADAGAAAAQEPAEAVPEPVADAADAAVDAAFGLDLSGSASPELAAEISSTP